MSPHIGGTWNTQTHRENRIAVVRGKGEGITGSYSLMGTEFQEG